MTRNGSESDQKSVISQAVQEYKIKESDIEKLSKYVKFPKVVEEENEHLKTAS